MEFKLGMISKKHEVFLTLSKDKLNVIINANNFIILNEIKDFFTCFVPNHKFMPRARFGWDGKVCLYNSRSRSIPYGLVHDLLVFFKKQFNENQVNVEVSSELKELFKSSKEVAPVYNLKHYPYPYQEECIKIALQKTKGIVVSPTSSGKSCIIAYIIKTLMENGLSNKILIIVPTISLVDQFHSDLIDYGFEASLLGKVYSKAKEFDKSIVISTWQSLMSNHDKLLHFTTVICDETHISKQLELSKVLKALKNAKYRLGFTGTLPEDRLSLLNIKAYLGPILKRITASDLMEQGYISKCKIHCLNINYNYDFDGTFSEIKDEVFAKYERLAIIRDVIIDHVKSNNILILVNKVETEGRLLKDYLSRQPLMKHKEIIFLSGETPVEEREYWRKEYGNKQNLVFIATYGILAVGINIPSLKYLMLGSSSLSKVKVLQSLGRALRLHFSKVDGAVIFDLIDNIKFLKRHGSERKRYYAQENFDYKEFTLNATIEPTLRSKKK